MGSCRLLLAETCLLLFHRFPGLAELLPHFPRSQKYRDDEMEDQPVQKIKQERIQKKA